MAALIETHPNGHLSDLVVNALAERTAKAVNIVKHKSIEQILKYVEDSQLPLDLMLA